MRQGDGKIFYDIWLEELISLERPYYSKWSTDHCSPYQIPKGISHRKRKNSEVHTKP